VTHILADMTDNDLVSVVYRKYDGELHWNLRMRRLGSDEHGVWLGLPAGSTMRKGEGPPVPLAEAHVILVPQDVWHTVVFNAAPRRTAIYCDITTPPQWIGTDEVTMVDLDLDVLLRRGETAPFLVDEDEFAEHRVRYAYPAEVVESAEASARSLLKAIADRTGPFDGAHTRWLDQVTRGRLG
jgi:protein associated with RNAse G/E